MARRNPYNGNHRDTHWQPDTDMKDLKVTAIPKTPGHWTIDLDGKAIATVGLTGHGRGGMIVIGALKKTCPICAAIHKHMCMVGTVGTYKIGPVKAAVAAVAKTL